MLHSQPGSATAQQQLPEPQRKAENAESQRPVCTSYPSESDCHIRRADTLSKKKLPMCLDLVRRIFPRKGSWSGRIYQPFSPSYAQRRENINISYFVPSAEKPHAETQYGPKAQPKSAYRPAQFPGFRLQRPFKGVRCRTRQETQSQHTAETQPCILYTAALTALNMLTARINPQVLSKVLLLPHVLFHAPRGPQCIAGCVTRQEGLPTGR